MAGWIELRVAVPAESADAVSEWLISSGAPGTIEEEVAGEPERLRVRAHFPGDRDASRVRDELGGFLSALETFFPGSAAANVEVGRIADDDWAEGWKRGFPPLDVGRRLHVRPPWAAPAPRGRLDVAIEPAMAFGTGHHASTLGCLLALEELADESPVRARVHRKTATLLVSARGLGSVLDVGAGSGILAIAAARLGARRVVAVDPDAVAVAAAAANLRLNRLEPAVDLRIGTAQDVEGAFDVVVANLYTGLLCAGVARFARIAAADARLVAAGLLDADAESVAGAAGRAGWREERRRSLDGWTTLVFRKSR